MSRDTYPLLSTDSTSGASARVSGLHLKHRPEQVIRQCGQKVDFSVGMQTVQIGRFCRQNLVDVGVVALVVRIGRDGESRSQEQLTIKLK